MRGLSVQTLMSQLQQLKPFLFEIKDKINNNQFNVYKYQLSHEQHCCTAQIKVLEESTADIKIIGHSFSHFCPSVNPSVCPSVHSITFVFVIEISQVG